HLVSSGPRQERFHFPEQAAKLIGAQIRRRAAAEIDELQGSSAHGGSLTIQLDFLDQGIEVELDIACVLIGVDAEIAELAALTAKGNVQVEPKRRARLRRLLQDGLGLRQILGLPGGK